jgi:hypothetical protein
MAAGAVVQMIRMGTTQEHGNSVRWHLMLFCSMPIQLYMPAWPNSVCC